MSWTNENGDTMVEHHVKYKELHGVDETVWMTNSEHVKLHARLRKGGMCNIPSDELKKISTAANSRTVKCKNYNNIYEKTHIRDRRTMGFCDFMMPGVRHRERIVYNETTNTLFVSCAFEAPHSKLYYIGG